MSERIICNDNGGELREEIVRCRDCRFYRPEGEKRISGVWEIPKPSWCMKLHISNCEPNGYCSWGERKESSDD